MRFKQHTIHTYKLCKILLSYIQFKVLSIHHEAANTTFKYNFGTALENESYVEQLRGYLNPNAYLRF